MEDDNESDQVIIYTSRTHSQLTQCMKELKATSYNHMRAVALGSRDQLCIDSDIINSQSNGGERVQQCRAKIKDNKCKYYQSTWKSIVPREVHNHTVLDIEDLVTIGKFNSVCPYYLAKNLTGKADIVFTPYNNILDQKLQKSFPLKLKDSIIIFDEAHNVEKVCQEVASTQISSTELSMCINDMNVILKILRVNNRDTSADKLTIEDCSNFLISISGFKRELESVPLSGRPKSQTLSGDDIFKRLQTIQINFETQHKWKQKLKNMITFLSENNAKNIFGCKARGLSKLLDFLNTVFGYDKILNCDEYQYKRKLGYRTYIVSENSVLSREGPTSLTDKHLPRIIAKAENKSHHIIYNFWCFDPSVSIANLISQNVHSFILSSGTLAPVELLIKELGIEANHILENPHIIKPAQIMAKIISYGPNGTLLTGNYENRSNIEYIKEMGVTIRTIANFTPNGLLIFFPSYSLIDHFIEKWKEMDLWSSIDNIKPIYVEPRDQNNFEKCISEYYKTVKNSQGAILIAVLRGKVSEGLNFKDVNGRTVIIAGIPFPPLHEPKVKLKMDYVKATRGTQTNSCRGGNVLSPAEQAWINNEAMQSVNQAIGRVIRHVNDFGAIFLCDQRFHKYKPDLSKWLQPHLKQQTATFRFGLIIKDLNEFFPSHNAFLTKNINTTLPIKVDKATILREVPKDTKKLLTLVTITIYILFSANTIIKF